MLIGLGTVTEILHFCGSGSGLLLCRGQLPLNMLILMDSEGKPGSLVGLSGEE